MSSSHLKYFRLHRVRPRIRMWTRKEHMREGGHVIKAIRAIAFRTGQARESSRLSIRSESGDLHDVAILGVKVLRHVRVRLPSSCVDITGGHFGPLDFGHVILSTHRPLWRALRSRRKPHEAGHCVSNNVEKGRLWVKSPRCFVEARHPGIAASFAIVTVLLDSKT